MRFTNSKCLFLFTDKLNDSWLDFVFSFRYARKHGSLEENFFKVLQVRFDRRRIVASVDLGEHLGESGHLERIEWLRGVKRDADLSRVRIYRERTPNEMTHLGRHVAIEPGTHRLDNHSVAGISKLRLLSTRTRGFDLTLQLVPCGNPVFPLAFEHRSADRFVRDR